MEAFNHRQVPDIPPFSIIKYLMTRPTPTIMLVADESGKPGPFWNH